MRKFFFDDVRDPYDSSWTLVRDVPTAKKVLLEREFDIMSLDHDIGYQMLCERCFQETTMAHVPGNGGMVLDNNIESMLKRGCTHNEDGTTLAKWMVEHLPYWPKLIYIHSANPYASERMKGILTPCCSVVISSYPTLRAIFTTEAVHELVI